MGGTADLSIKPHEIHLRGGCQVETFNKLNVHHLKLPYRYYLATTHMLSNSRFIVSVSCIPELRRERSGFQERSLLWKIDRCSAGSGSGTTAWPKPISSCIKKGRLIPKATYCNALHVAMLQHPPQRSESERPFNTTLSHVQWEYCNVWRGSRRDVSDVSQILNRIFMMSPSCTGYSFPSRRKRPFSLSPFSVPH